MITLVYEECEQKRRQLGQNILAQNIRRLIKERGLTQQELADKVGISRVHLNNILTGKKGKRIPQETLQKIAQALGVSVSELLEERSEEEPPQLKHIAKKVKFLPVIAAVKAGTPEEPIQFKYTSKTYPYVGELPCKEEDCFIIEVDGDSMSPTLQKGDYILVKKIDKYPMLIPENFENKIVVAANKNWEYTIKRLKKIGNKYYLAPDNPQFEIEEINDWQIVGVALERLPKPQKL